MTYLTQILLNSADALRGGLHDSYDWHQAAWNAFPGRDGKPRDFLTRLDQKGEDIRLLIVSSDPPVRPEWCPPNPGCWQAKQIPDTYFSRRLYRFQLRANPTRKERIGSTADGTRKKNGRRVPLRSKEELVNWLKAKGAAGGFSVDEDTLRTISEGREYFQKKGSAGLHSSVEFQGILRVTDPALFHQTFSRGIGSAKAFGFGLLVIAPIS
jgi:CRISPR system Cascade subunit CasE